MPHHADERRLDLFTHYRLAAYAGGFRMHDGA